MGIYVYAVHKSSLFLLPLTAVKWTLIFITKTIACIGSNFSHFSLVCQFSVSVKWKHLTQETSGHGRVLAFCFDILKLGIEMWWVNFAFQYSAKGYEQEDSPWEDATFTHYNVNDLTIISACAKNSSSQNLLSNLYKQLPTHWRFKALSLSPPTHLLASSSNKKLDCSKMSEQLKF